ncbi:MAG: hypothetical protein CVU97_04985 [Firmicutes bacterium HGW-Firmicutes-21]|nr:MAG: hypothetical protein CVU97_04985 [Firmicutes bacterium HGW-Firmicutes-21]
MQTNRKNHMTTVLILLILVSALTVILASCDTGFSGNDFTNSIPNLTSKDESSADTVSEQYTPPEGYTDRPIVMDIKNVAPDTVVISGKCEEGAKVTIEGGKQNVTVGSRNGYFIAEITLSNTTTTLLEATAVVEDKERSEPLSFTAKYIATAEKRKDNYRVSVGVDSQLYFDIYLDNYLGSNLLTQTNLRGFKNSINARKTNIENRARGQDVQLVYVLVPDATTVYPEIFPSDVVRSTFTTRYEQVSSALSETNATVIDMYETLLAAKQDGQYEIYRKNDSHLTEYGAYLVYEQIANVLKVNFPEAGPRSLDEFDIKTAKSVGGDLISYLGITKENYTESVVNLVPKFSLQIGHDENSDISTVNISDVRKYKSADDFSIYNYTDPKVIGIRDRFIIRTNREELPSAIIYRDDSVYPMIDILSERFNNAMIARSGDYVVNLIYASSYRTEGKTLVDYVIVIVSESNIQNILN